MCYFFSLLGLCFLVQWRNVSFQSCHNEWEINVSFQCLISWLTLSYLGIYSDIVISRYIYTVLSCSYTNPFSSAILVSIHVEGHIFLLSLQTTPLIHSASEPSAFFIFLIYFQMHLLTARNGRWVGRYQSWNWYVLRDNTSEL